MAEKRKPGRPLGSKSKPKVELQQKSNGSVMLNIKLEKQLEGLPINRKSGQGWVNWGRRNDYPAQLAELYYNSVTHKACIDFAHTAILGGGIDYDAMEVDSSDIRPNYQETWNDLLSGIIFDYTLFGGFAMQIIKNRDGKTYSFFHQPFSQVRFSPKNEDGAIESYWVSSDWTQTGLYKPIELESFSFTDEKDLEMGKAYLFVYTKYTPMMDTYPTPHYISALKSIQSEIELQRYDLRSITNNFSASGILTLNRVDDEDEKRMLIEGITAMYTGSDNANSLLINFKENNDDTPANFVSISRDSKSSVDLFSETNERIINKIVAGHKILSKSLIGYDLVGASLQGNGNTMRVAYELYMSLFGNSLQTSIIDSINNALKLNGVETQLIMKKLFSEITSDTSYEDNSTAEDTEKSTSENQGKNLT